MPDILPNLKKVVLEDEDKVAVRLAKSALEEKVPPIDISQAIVSGISDATELRGDN